MIHWASPISRSKRHHDQFSCFRTSDRRVSLYNGRSLPPKLPLPMENLDPHLTHDSLGTSEPKTQTASRSVPSVLYRWPHSVPIFYNAMGTPPFPHQNCLFPWGIWTPSSTWFPGPTRVLNANGISIGSAVFARLTSVTDRQTTLLGR